MAFYIVTQTSETNDSTILYFPAANSSSTSRLVTVIDRGRSVVWRKEVGWKIPKTTLCVHKMLLLLLLLAWSSWLANSEDATGFGGSGTSGSRCGCCCWSPGIVASGLWLMAPDEAKLMRQQSASQSTDLMNYEWNRAKIHSMAKHCTYIINVLVEL